MRSNLFITCQVLVTTFIVFFAVVIWVYFYQYLFTWEENSAGINMTEYSMLGYLWVVLGYLCVVLGYLWVFLKEKQSFLLSGLHTSAVISAYLSASS